MVVGVHFANAYVVWREAARFLIKLIKSERERSMKLSWTTGNVRVRHLVVEPFEPFEMRYAWVDPLGGWGLDTYQAVDRVMLRAAGNTRMTARKKLNSPHITVSMVSAETCARCVSLMIPMELSGCMHSIDIVLCYSHLRICSNRISASTVRA